MQLISSIAAIPKVKRRKGYPERHSARPNSGNAQRPPRYPERLLLDISMLDGDSDLLPIHSLHRLGQLVHTLQDYIAVFLGLVSAGVVELDGLEVGKQLLEAQLRVRRVGGVPNLAVVEAQADVRDDVQLVSLGVVSQPLT
jgi:hypothetical protein